MRRLSAALVAALGLLLSFAAPALAHPHIFIDAKAAIVFNDAGDVVAIKHQWTFDEAFSAWSIQGLDTNNDGVTSEAELQPLADENMKGLAAYNYYTSMGEPGQPDLTFHHMPDPRLDYADQRTTLRFGIELDKPYRIKKTLEIGIDDPEYYVAITFDGPKAVTLENAPAGCHAVLNPPKDIPTELANKLYSIGADVVKLPPDLEAAMRGMQGSIDVTCDYSVAGPKQNPTAEDVTPVNASTAVDAANAMGAARPIPFGGPPRELGVWLPNSGVVAWILAEQKQFYQLLTNAMTQLKTDNRAFLVLGSLSFLYGIFHAAGPGHGKVVISSYVLANERQYRKGMILSFTSAMLASAVAVLFILFAALVLNLTGDAMGSAASWIGIGSYLMVAALGVWLMIRHIFGIGHHHHDDDAPAAADDRRDHKLARQHLFADDDDGAVPAGAVAFDTGHAGHGHDHAHDHDEHHPHHHPHPGHDDEAHEAAAGAPRRLPTQQNILARAFETSSRVAAGQAGGPAYAFAESGAAPTHGHLHDGREGHGHDHDHDHDHDHAAEHGHAAHSHVAVTPDQLRHGGWREALSVVLAIGLRPCSGALVVLVFALAQGVLWAGIASVFLMGLGTSITVAALATLAMTAKGLAGRLTGGRSRLAATLVWWGKLGAAFMVFALGILLAVANLWG